MQSAFSVSKAYKTSRYSRQWSRIQRPVWATGMIGAAMAAWPAA